MKVLIVEDDDFKRRKIADAVEEILPDAEVVLEKSVNSGLKAIVEQNPALVLLDMSLTTFDVGPNEAGGRPQNFGGIEILRHMDRLELKVPVIVITQHERFANSGREVRLSAMMKDLTEQHGDLFRGLVYYNSAAGAWQNQLKGLIKKCLREGQTPNADKGAPSRRR